MTREEAKAWFKVLLKDEYAFNSADREAFAMAIKALEQEPCDVFDEYGNYKYPSDVELTEPNTATSMPCEDADMKLIHTQGLDEGIKCAMCTNSMANDKGCDGGCVVNEVMYKRILDVIRKHIIDGGG